jgi:hypothetical protein
MIYPHSRWLHSRSDEDPPIKNDRVHSQHLHTPWRTRMHDALSNSRVKRVVLTNQAILPSEPRWYVFAEGRMAIAERSSSIRIMNSMKHEAVCNRFFLPSRSSSGVSGLGNHPFVLRHRSGGFLASWLIGEGDVEGPCLFQIPELVGYAST